MNFSLLIILLLFCLSHAELLLVIEFFRHGARQPEEQKFFEYKHWKIPGSLTTVGERQHYLLGHLRRKQYIEDSEFLPKIYDPSLIYARTSVYNRTMMSLESYFLGLYPEGLSQLTNKQLEISKNYLKPKIPLTIDEDIIKNLGNQPLPHSMPMVNFFHTTLDKEGLFLHNGCPLGKETRNQYAKLGYPRTFNSYREVWQEITNRYKNITMKDLQHNFKAISLCDLLICADSENIRPQFITGKIIKKCRDFLSDTQNGEIYYNTNNTKASTKPLAIEILKWMNERIEGKTKVKYAIYSGHDFTLVRLLAGLKELNKTIEIKTLPAFAANIRFELYRNKDNYSVKALYDDDVIYRNNYEIFKKGLEKAGEVSISYKEACRVDN